MQDVYSVHLLFEIRFVHLDISYTFQLIFIRLLPQYIDPVLHTDIILFWYRDQRLLLFRRPSHIVIDQWQIHVSITWLIQCLDRVLGQFLNGELLGKGETIFYWHFSLGCLCILLLHGFSHCSVYFSRHSFCQQIHLSVELFQLVLLVVQSAFLALF